MTQVMEEPTAGVLEESTEQESAMAVLEAWEEPEAQDQADEETPDEPALPDYGEVIGALRRLRLAVEGIANRDEIQLSDLLAELRAAYPSVSVGVQDGVGNAPAQTRERLLAALDQVEGFCQQVLEPHAEVPDQLDNAAVELRDRATALRGRSEQVDNLAAREEWTGQAAEAYRQVTKVQAKALTELGGVHDASAKALERAGLLNRAAFYYCAQSIGAAAAEVEQVQTGSSLELFAASKQVEAALRGLLQKLQEEVANVGTGRAAAALAQDLERVLNGPNLLQPQGWPVGPALAAAEPAKLEAMVASVEEPEDYMGIPKAEESSGVIEEQPEDPQQADSPGNSLT